MSRCHVCGEFTDGTLGGHIPTCWECYEIRTKTMTVTNKQEEEIRAKKDKRVYTHEDALGFKARSANRRHALRCLHRSHNAALAKVARLEKRVIKNSDAHTAGMLYGAGIMLAAQFLFIGTFSVLGLL